MPCVMDVFDHEGVRNMSDRRSRFLGKWRLTTIAMGITGFVAVLALGGVLAFYVTTAHGSGTGGGGCVSTTDPACTFKGNATYATFQSVSDDGCIFTQAQVSAYDNLTRPGHNASKTAAIYISTWDNCNGVPLSEATSFDPNTGASSFTGTIEFGSNLASATINGTASMYDPYSGSVLYTTTVNLTITGYGPSSKYSDSQHSHSPGFIMNTHFTGTSRSAEVSGTFTDNAGNNMAALPGLYAELQYSQGGTVQIFPIK